MQIVINSGLNLFLSEPSQLYAIEQLNPIFLENYTQT